MLLPPEIGVVPADQLAAGDRGHAAPVVDVDRRQAARQGCDIGVDHLDQRIGCEPCQRQPGMGDGVENGCGDMEVDVAGARAPAVPLARQPVDDDAVGHLRHLEARQVDVGEGAGQIGTDGARELHSAARAGDAFVDVERGVAARHAEIGRAVEQEADEAVPRRPGLERYALQLRRKLRTTPRNT